MSEKRHAETEEIISKTARFDSTIVESGILKQIIDELKNIRKEINENREETEQKLEEIRIEMEKNKDVSRDILKRISSLENEKKKNEPEDKSEDPIQTAFLGEWHLLEYENFEAFETFYNKTFESFAENLIYELEYEKLKQTGGGYANLVEGGRRYRGNELYFEGNHLKSFWTAEINIDRYLENGKLHVVNNLHGSVFKRIYGRVC